MYDYFDTLVVISPDLTTWIIKRRLLRPGIKLERTRFVNPMHEFSTACFLGKTKLTVLTVLDPCLYSVAGF